MANGDYGYFGKGDTGYAQYMTAFNRNFGGSSGGGASGNRGAAGDERYRCIGSVPGELEQALRGHFCFSLSFPQGKTMVY